AKAGAFAAVDAPFEVRRDDVMGVVVTLTQSRTLLKGTVVSAAGTPANSLDLVVLPADPRYLTRGTRRVAIARTNIAGEFEVEGLPPGAYEIATADDPDRDALQDPAALAALPRIGSVSLRKGETLTHRIVMPR